MSALRHQGHRGAPERRARVAGDSELPWFPGAARAARRQPGDSQARSALWRRTARIGLRSNSPVRAGRPAGSRRTRGISAACVPGDRCGIRLVVGRQRDWPHHPVRIKAAGPHWPAAGGSTLSRLRIGVVDAWRNGFALVDLLRQPGLGGERPVVQDAGPGGASDTTPPPRPRRTIAHPTAISAPASGPAICTPSSSSSRRWQAQDRRTGLDSSMLRSPDSGPQA